ncbi:unnamed protein product [Sphagnum jensenii]
MARHGLHPDGRKSQQSMGHGTARAYIPTAEKVSKVWGMARHGLEVGDGADSSQYATCMSRSSTSAVT